MYSILASKGHGNAVNALLVKVDPKFQNMH